MGRGHGVRRECVSHGDQGEGTLCSIRSIWATTTRTFEMPQPGWAGHSALARDSVMLERMRREPSHLRGSKTRDWAAAKTLTHYIMEKKIIITIKNKMKSEKHYHAIITKLFFLIWSPSTLGEERCLCCTYPP